jgi:hypothetical protein
MDDGRVETAKFAKGAKNGNQRQLRESGAWRIKRVTLRTTDSPARSTNRFNLRVLGGCLPLGDMKFLRVSTFARL